MLLVLKMILIDHTFVGPGNVMASQSFGVTVFSVLIPICFLNCKYQIRKNEADLKRQEEIIRQKTLLYGQPKSDR